MLAVSDVLGLCFCRTERRLADLDTRAADCLAGAPLLPTVEGRIPLCSEDSFDGASEARPAMLCLALGAAVPVLDGGRITPGRDAAAPTGGLADAGPGASFVGDCQYLAMYQRHGARNSYYRFPTLCPSHWRWAKIDARSLCDRVYDTLPPRCVR